MIVAVVDLASDAEPGDLAGLLGQIDLIRIDFPACRRAWFTIAAQLRRMGFVGRLRARGHVIADQYATARDGPDLMRSRRPCRPPAGNH
jgi:uncharacterized protein (DUF934 family)